MTLMPRSAKVTLSESKQQCNLNFASFFRVVCWADDEYNLWRKMKKSNEITYGIWNKKISPMTTDTETLFKLLSEVSKYFHSNALHFLSPQLSKWQREKTRPHNPAKWINANVRGMAREFSCGSLGEEKKPNTKWWHFVEMFHSIILGKNTFFQKDVLPFPFSLMHYIMGWFSSNLNSFCSLRSFNILTLQICKSYNRFNKSVGNNLISIICSYICSFKPLQTHSKCPAEILPSQ